MSLKPVCVVCKNPGRPTSIYKVGWERRGGRVSLCQPCVRTVPLVTLLDIIRQRTNKAQPIRPVASD